MQVHFHWGIMVTFISTIGIMLSSLAKREAQAVNLFHLLYYLFSCFLVFSDQYRAIPVWLRPLSYLVPPTYAVDACKSVLLKGWGIGKIWPDIMALVLFAALFLVIATWSLKIRKG